MDTVSLLVLDDIDAVRRRILELLVDLNIDHFLEARSAQDAIQVITIHHPTEAILDIQVPGTPDLKNGIDVLRWICNNHPQTTVIMLSNHDHPRYRAACRALGAMHYFDKSSEFEQLHDAVQALLTSQ